MKHSLVLKPKLLLLVLSLSFNIVFAQNSDIRQWSLIETSTSPHARHEASFIGLKNSAYLIGGRRLQPVDKFDFDTTQWVVMAKPPIEIHHFQAVVWQGKIVLVGGFTGGWPNEKPINRVLVFDPIENEFEFTHSIPTARLRGAAGVAVYADKIYVVGGIQNGHIDGHVTWVDEYDPATGVWRQLPDAPNARDHFQAVVVGNKLYAIGGRLSSEATQQPFERTLGTVDVFDFKSQQWESLPQTLDLPTQRAGNMAIAIKDRIIIAGGESGNQVLAHSEVEVLNTKQLTWERWPDMQKSRHGTGIVQHMDRIYTASGCLNRGGEPELKSIEFLDLTKR